MYSPFFNKVAAIPIHRQLISVSSFPWSPHLLLETWTSAGAALPQFCATISLAYFAGRTDRRPKVLWLVWSLHFFPSSMQSTFPYQRLWNLAETPVLLLHCQWGMGMLSSAIGSCCVFVESEPLSCQYCLGFLWYPFDLLKNLKGKWCPCFKGLSSNISKKVWALDFYYVFRDFSYVFIFITWLIFLPQ